MGAAGEPLQQSAAMYFPSNCFAEIHKNIRVQLRHFLYHLTKNIPFERGLRLFSGSACQEEADAEYDSVSKSQTNETAARLLDTYGNAILRLAYAYLHNSADAEDILQDTLLKYLQAAPPFQSDAHEKAWLLRVAANLSKNKLSYNKIRQTDELEDSLVADEREDLAFVWQAVKQLPDAQRLPIHLYYHEGLSGKEIAAVLQMQESTVRSHLRRGREKLKEILKEGYDFA